MLAHVTRAWTSGCPEAFGYRLVNADESLRQSVAGEPDS